MQFSDSEKPHVTYDSDDSSTIASNANSRILSNSHRNVFSPVKMPAENMDENRVNQSVSYQDMLEAALGLLDLANTHRVLTCEHIKESSQDRTGYADENECNYHESGADEDVQSLLYLSAMEEPSQISTSADLFENIMPKPKLEEYSSSKSKEASDCDKPLEKKFKNKKVSFSTVTVYYFHRSQGFVSVPHEGGSTLGMEQKHSQMKMFSIDDHVKEKIRLHRFLHQSVKCRSGVSYSNDSKDINDVSDSELEANSCCLIQQLPIQERYSLLRASGVQKINSLENDECSIIRLSRQSCGCKCKITCDPETCTCSLDGINCQVDRSSFPCGCSHYGCGNTSGRTEFYPLRVRTHFIHTILRLERDKKRK